MTADICMYNLCPSPVSSFREQLSEDSEVAYKIHSIKGKIFMDKEL